MKKPSKTAAELEASIKVEMEDICDWPTDMTISVQPDGDSWKVKVVQEASGDDADRREMVEQIAARLKAEYDLKGWCRWVWSAVQNGSAPQAATMLSSRKESKWT